MKKNHKKLLSVLLAGCMLTSAWAVGNIPASAENEQYVTYAQQTVDGSVILHCFDWSYNSIKAALPDIAAAGYTAVQTSPVQSPKDYNASWTDGKNQWWKLYQPLGFSVSDGQTWLGTKAELTSMCTEAEKYGIKVIVDIVANHLANNGSSGGGYGNLNSGVDSDLKKDYYYHSNTDGTNDNSRYNITQNHLGQPDLNTGHPDIQQKVLGLLKECIDCGVDGFRFDAAKHIEVPRDDSSFSSSFWPTVINGATNYADNELYFYGEILGSPGPNCDISYYTEYMDVTDNYTGDRALDKTYWQAASELADSTYYKGTSASESVLWVESHDTYMGNSGMAGFSNTADISNDVINRAWAIVASRADSTSLFFARPNSIMGEASTDTNWKSTAVAEVNKFKNAFEGKNEYLSSSGNIAYNERGTKGVVISKLDGTSGNVNLTAHMMEDGTYTDQITGNTFTVSNGIISGTVGNTGVAVVYNPDNLKDPVITESTLYLVPNEVWKNRNLRYAMYLFDEDNNSTWVSMESLHDGKVYYADVPDGNWTHVIFCGLNSNSANNWNNVVYQTNDLHPNNTDCYIVMVGTYSNGGGTWSVYDSSNYNNSSENSETSQDTENSSITVYVTGLNNWGNMYIYYWGSNSNNPDWPGFSMTSHGDNIYSAEIPSDVIGIIFNNNAGQQTVDIYASDINDNRHWTISNETDEGKYKVKLCYYYLVGSMNGWSTNDNYIFTLVSAENNVLEYKLSGVSLSADTTLKVCSSNNDWYPSGMNNNYTVTHDSIYDIYFRQNGDGNGDGNSDWHCGYFYLSDTRKYTVTWLDSDGSLLFENDNISYGQTDYEKPVDPQKENYEFIGWYLDDTLYYYDKPITSDITLTAKWKVSDGTGATLENYSITLDGAVGINFYMDIDTNIADENAYIEFTVPGETEKQIVYIKDAESGDNGYKFTCNVSAKEMASPVTAQVVSGNTRGITYSYSVKDYADYILEHSEQYPNEVALVKSMLNYGAYSQLYFEPDTAVADLANDGMTTADKELGEVSITEPEASANLPDSVTFEGSTLSLKSQITLSLYFTSDEELTFNAGDDITVEKAVSGKYQVARIRNIPISDLQESITLTVTAGSESGTITYSPLNYCYKALNGGTSNESLINAVKALYLYSEEAKTYFGIE